jgi:hypothetical protein
MESLLLSNCQVIKLNFEMGQCSKRRKSKSPFRRGLALLGRHDEEVPCLAQRGERFLFPVPAGTLCASVLTSDSIFLHLLREDPDSRMATKDNYGTEVRLRGRALA